MKKNKDHKPITLKQFLKVVRLLITYKPDKKIQYKEPTQDDLERKYRLDIK